MAFGLDAAVAADLAFARIRIDEALVPSIWWFETRNVLVVSERRQRITESGTTAFLQALSELRIRTVPTPNEGQVLRLARLHNLSVYDASYLEPAQKETLPLATLDAKLARAARAEGVAILGEKS